MNPKPKPVKNNHLPIILSLVIMAVVAVGLWYWWNPLWDFSNEMWQLLQDKEAFRARINAYGAWAPVAFIIFQIFQVLLSPIPGELVGAAGGYVFDWLPSLFYSTVGLSLGSWINFLAARFMGQPFVERMIPDKLMARMKTLMERQGMIASFIFFVIPGFPKDYFCYALGLSPMSWRVFLVISSVGRIPGTLVLSLQGALLYQENYWSFLWLGALSLAFILPVYIWRERIYRLLCCLDNNGAAAQQGPAEDEQSSCDCGPDKK